MNGELGTEQTGVHEKVSDLLYEAACARMYLSGTVGD